MLTRAPEVEAPARPRLRWWREVLYIAIFYGIYSFVRNRFGSATVGPETALQNAETIIAIERALHLFFEEPLQQLFLGARWFIGFWNFYYGTFHFVVTAVALIVIFRRRPDYKVWRNTLAVTTGLAIAGFALFPLMPPRLLNEGPPYGGAAYAEEDYGFVDTLAEIGGSWSFNDETMKSISNQYAAMPSLHCAWALWVTLVLWPLSRRRWQRVLLVVYPLATLFCIVVTANHYWLDGAGGVLVLGVGYVVGSWLARLDRGRPLAAAASASRAER